VKRFPVALSLLAALALVVAGPASGAQLKRHESRWWVWYGPPGWVSAESANGIDITSPTGVFHAGYGWSSSAFPLNNGEVRDYLASSGGLDVHPLARLSFLRTGRAFSFAGGTRQVSVFRAYRTNRRQWIKGILKVDVFNDESTGSYGFAASVTGAPLREFRASRSALDRIVKLIFFKPRSPWE
jgi:opacity protein-like surface antigen